MSGYQFPKRTRNHKDFGGDVMKGIRAIGRKELTRHLEGKRLTSRQSIFAKCYDCMGGYVDGRFTCNIPQCPLYPYMPYRGNQVEDAS